MVFPEHHFTSKEGILAIGGDLSVERLVLAYQNGIFPWYNQNEPILWWSPPERFVLFLEELNIDRTLKKVLKKNAFRITKNQAFEKVISKCRSVRIQSGTWLTKDMLHAYETLFKNGYASSIEVWYEENLVGGLYGVSLGKYFCGESMFSLMNNASKIALIALCEEQKKIGATFIDCQVYTPHLEKMGARNIPRKRFLELLKGCWV